MTATAPSALSVAPVPVCHESRCAPIEHNLIAQRRIRARDLGEDVVAVPVVLEISRPQLYAQRHRFPRRRQAGDHVVLLAGHDDRRNRIRRGRPIAGDADRAVPVRARPERHGRTGPLQQGHQVGVRRGAPRLRQRRVARGHLAIVEAGLRPVAGDELDLRKMRQHDGAAKLPGHRLDLRSGLVADIQHGPAQYPCCRRRPCVGVRNERNVPRFRHRHRQLLELPAAPELVGLEVRVREAPFREAIDAPSVRPACAPAIRSAARRCRPSASGTGPARGSVAGPQL